MGSHDLDHPDELRVDLDPVPGAAWPQVREVALLTREVERRTPDLATSRWWKEERHGVFIDHNRNARDRTVASAYSVRPTPEAQVSTPPAWDEVATCQPEAFTMETLPRRLARIGDPWRHMDAAVLRPSDRGGESGHRGRGRGGPGAPAGRHPEVWARPHPDGVQVDAMRGCHTTWTRIRVNLRHVPETERQPQGPLDVDHDPRERR